MKKPNLERLSEAFGRAHRSVAKYELKKKEAREKLIQAVDQSFDEQELARQTIWVSVDSIPTSFEEYIAIHWPKWRLVEAKGMADGDFQILLEERPEYKKRVIFNRRDGMVYQRNVSESTPDFDMDRIKVEDPELFERVTKITEVRDWKPLKEISDEDKAKMLQYMTPPKLTVKIDQPRPPKAEEMEAFNE